MPRKSVLGNPSAIQPRGRFGYAMTSLAFQEMVKRWTDYYAVTAFSRPRPVVAEDLDLPEAFLQWGEASDFGIEEPFRDQVSFRFNVIDEVERETSTVRVGCPDDPNQFVDVERTDSITFRGGGINNLKLNFNN